MIRHIFIIGLPGAGKTTFGKRLAEELQADGYEFLDMDEAISQATGKSVTDIFRERGEEEFRHLETDFLEILSQEASPKIIATGGGAVMRPLNRVLMRASGIRLWLATPVELIAERSHDKSFWNVERPLLPKAPAESILSTLSVLLEARHDAYADCEIEVKDAESFFSSFGLVTEAALHDAFHSTTNHPHALRAKSALGDYPVVTGIGIAEHELGWQLRAHGIKKIFIVTDDTVRELYALRMAEHLATTFEVHTHILPAGEEAKSFPEAGKIFTRAEKVQVMRKSTAVVAIGGGVVGDVAGFAASVIQRGVPLIHIPTTLLSQVDSSVGGKTGVNSDSGKNLIGTFYPPRAVIIDTKYLASLPRREVINGMGEVLKYGLVASPKLWKKANHVLHEGLHHERVETLGLIKECVQIKLDIVGRDEFERREGIRELLNFGHTFAHALEAATHYTFYRHGEAVILGMRAAAWLSHEIKLLSAVEFEEIEQSLARIHLPHPTIKPSPEELEEKMSHDKKYSSRQRFVLLKKIGEAVVTEETSDTLRKKSLEYFHTIL